jgi:hypothetical protein
VGESYLAAAAPGGVAPITDLVATNFPTVLGIAQTTSTMVLGILVGGVAKP